MRSMRLSLTSARAQLGLVDRALRDIGLDSWIGRGITRVYAYSIVASNQSLTTLANNMTNLDGRQDEHWLVVRNGKDGALNSYNNGSIVRPICSAPGPTRSTWRRSQIRRSSSDGQGLVS